MFGKSGHRTILNFDLFLAHTLGFYGFNVALFFHVFKIGHSNIVLLGLSVWTEQSLTEALCACGVFWPQACLAQWDFTHCAAQCAHSPLPDPGPLQKCLRNPNLTVLRFCGSVATVPLVGITSIEMHACSPLYPDKHTHTHTPSYIPPCPRRPSRHFHLLQFTSLALVLSLPVLF